MTPKRIQRQRTKGWRMPENTVYVGRPSLFGNPWAQEDAADRYNGHRWREWCVDAYRREIEHWGLFVDWEGFVAPVASVPIRERIDSGELATFKDLIRDQLRGKNLACWCPEDAVCHGDLLLELANGGEA